MKLQDEGIVYKAAPRAFVGNYLIVIGLIVLAFLVINTFSFVFSINPTTLGELVSTIVYVGFAAAIIYLGGEFFFEGTVTKYVMTRNGIMRVAGILWKKKLLIPYQNISEVNVIRGIFSRMLNYGTVEVSGYKENVIIMKHMPDPDEIRRLLQSKIDQTRRSVEKKRNA